MTTVGLVGRLKASIIYCLFMSSVDPPCCRRCSHLFEVLACSVAWFSNPQCLRVNRIKGHWEMSPEIIIWREQLTCRCVMLAWFGASAGKMASDVAAAGSGPQWIWRRAHTPCICRAVKPLPQYHEHHASGGGGGGGGVKRVERVNGIPWLLVC